MPVQFPKIQDLPAGYETLETLGHLSGVYFVPGTTFPIGPQPLPLYPADSLTLAGIVTGAAPYGGLLGVSYTAQSPMGDFGLTYAQGWLFQSVALPAAGPYSFYVNINKSLPGYYQIAGAGGVVVQQGAVAFQFGNLYALKLALVNAAGAPAAFVADYAFIGLS